MQRTVSTGLMVALGLTVAGCNGGGGSHGSGQQWAGGVAPVEVAAVPVVPGSTGVPPEIVDDALLLCRYLARRGYDMVQDYRAAGVALGAPSGAPAEVQMATYFVTLDAETLAEKRGALQAVYDEAAGACAVAGVPVPDL